MPAGGVRPGSTGRPRSMTTNANSPVSAAGIAFRAPGRERFGLLLGLLLLGPLPGAQGGVC